MEIIEMLFFCNCSDIEELIQWKNVMKNRRSLESYLNTLVKQVIEEEHSRGVVCDKLQQNLKKAVLQITHLNQVLKIVLSELNLDIADALDNLTNEKLKNDVGVLKEQNERLKIKLHNLKQEKLQISQDQQPLLAAAIQNIDDNNLLINGKLYCLKEVYYQQYAEALRAKDSLISHLRNQLANCKAELQNSKDEQERLRNSLQRQELEGGRFRSSGDNNDSCANLQQKLEVLKETLYDRDMKLEKLDEDSQNLLQKHSLLEADFSKAQFQYEKMEKLVEELKLDLLKCKEERDICMRQNEFLQQKLLKLKQQNRDRDRENLSDEDQAKRDISVDVAKKPEEYSSEVTSSLNEIDKMDKVIEDIHLEIEKFSGTQEDKNFLHLREMLIQNVLKLDNIHTGGMIEVRQARKAVIEKAYALLNTLTEKSSCTSTD